MHAINCFLISIDESDVAADARSQLESWMDNHGDENTWYTESLLCLRDGRVLSLEDGLWKPNEWVIEKLKLKKASNAFEWAHRLALDCVCLDMGLSGPELNLIPPTESQKTEMEQLASMSFGDVLQYIADTVPKRLSQMYADLKVGQDIMIDYRRRRLSRTFELYWDSTTKPFATSGTPYDYRAFDVTYGEDLSDRSAILLVDVHT